MSEGVGPLPVSVVVPSRNCAPYVPRHLESLEEWIDLVEEVVVVDSDSTDGTVDLLRRGIRHPRARFLRHPPGLYESWNHGIGQVRSKYTYIATVGDSITRAGLQHLVEVAEQFRSDVVVSPPRFVVGSGEPPVHRIWPIHRLLGWLGSDEPQALSGAHAFLVTALLSPEGILGSSASNLYRTDVLQRRPFPPQFGRCGDTAWALMHALEARWAVTPRVISEFLVHPNGAFADGTDPARDLAFHRLVESACRAHASEEIPRLLLEWQSQTESLRQEEKRLKRSRRVGILWVMNPRAWATRARRDRLRANLVNLKRTLLGSVGAVSA